MMAAANSAQIFLSQQEMIPSMQGLSGPSSSFLANEVWEMQ